MLPGHQPTANSISAKVLTMLTRWRRPTMYPTIAATAVQTCTITNEVASANGPMLIANGLTEVNLQSREWGDKVARPLLARKHWQGIVFQRCIRRRRGLHAKHHLRLQTGLAGCLARRRGHPGTPAPCRRQHPGLVHAAIVDHHRSGQELLVDSQGCLRCSEAVWALYTL